MNETEPNPGANPEARSAGPKTDAKAVEPRLEPTPARPEPEATTETMPGAEAGKPSDLTPQLVQRVHDLYAQLGREEVRAVLAWESAGKGLQENETKAELRSGVDAAKPEPEAKVTETKAEPKAEVLKPDSAAAEPKPQAKATGTPAAVKAVEPKSGKRAAEPTPDAKMAEPESGSGSKSARPKAEFRNKIIFTLSILGLAAALVAAYFFGRQRQSQPPVFKPVSSPYTSAIFANGIVEGDDPSGQNINIFPQVSGPITQILVHEGQQVLAGTLLFTIEDSVQRANTELAAANLKLARDQYDKDRASYDMDSNSISKDALDTAEDSVNQSASALKAAEALRQYYSVKAPVDGIVLAVNAAVGGYISSQGNYDSYTELFDPVVVMCGPQDYLDVRCFVDEILVSQLPTSFHIRAQMSLRGSYTNTVPLEFVRVQPYVSPKIELSNEKQEQVDLRVLPVIFRFEKKDIPVYPGQLVDVYIGSQ
jgi:HlyD family secretion protein